MPPNTQRTGDEGRKETCGICKYGDGKWEERQGQLMPNLPACDLCKADGWSIEPKEIIDALKKDPNFEVMERSPYYPFKNLLK